jgi:hypothetical protein
MNYRKAERLVVLVLLLAALMACKKFAKRGEASSSSADKVGIAECDEFLTKYEKCLQGVPAAAQPAMQQTIKQMRDNWKLTAQNPAAKAGLGMACKQAMEGTKAGMAAYNCQW